MFYEHVERVVDAIKNTQETLSVQERCITSLLEFLPGATSAKISEIRTSKEKDLEIEIRVGETTSLKIQKLVKNPSLNS